MIASADLALMADRIPLVDWRQYLVAGSIYRYLKAKDNTFGISWGRPDFIAETLNANPHYYCDHARSICWMPSARR